MRALLPKRTYTKEETQSMNTQTNTKDIRNKHIHTYTQCPVKKCTIRMRNVYIQNGEEVVDIMHWRHIKN